MKSISGVAKKISPQISAPPDSRKPCDSPPSRRQMARQGRRAAAQAQGSSSRVRGPHSALTEFLRSQGIDANEIRRRHARETEEALATAEATGAALENEVQAQDPAPSFDEDIAQVAGPSSAPILEEGGGAAEENEEDEEGEQVQVSKRKRRPKASTRKKKRVESDEDDFLLPGPPRPGQVEFCDNCNCRFTVTPYSRAGPSGGLLCHPCGVKLAGGIQKEASIKKQPAKRKPKAAMSALLDHVKFNVPKLQDLCIRLIAKHIGDVEAFGDIGNINMDKICRIISKNRSLNNTTLPLFLDAERGDICLYDCSKIDGDHLQSIASYCPSVQQLMLRFCGRLTDSTIRYYAHQLLNLRSVEFTGPFLVGVQGWKDFFQSMGTKLERFFLHDSPRFDTGVIESLVSNCTELSDLRLARIEHLDDSGVAALSSLSHLNSLDISFPGTTLTDEPILALLNKVGSGLLELNLSGNKNITDATLEAVRMSCGRLHTLHLDECEGLTEEGILSLLSNWSNNAGLQSLSLSRCIEIGDKAVAAILCHSGHSLQSLNLNSLETITARGLELVGAAECPALHTLDVSFVRAVDDKIMEKVANGCKFLSTVKVWGDHRVTNFASAIRPDLVIVGIETYQ